MTLTLTELLVLVVSIAAATGILGLLLLVVGATIVLRAATKTATTSPDEGHLELRPVELRPGFDPPADDHLAVAAALIARHAAEARDYEHQSRARAGGRQDTVLRVESAHQWETPPPRKTGCRACRRIREIAARIRHRTHTFF